MSSRPLPSCLTAQVWQHVAQCTTELSPVMSLPQWRAERCFSCCPVFSETLFDLFRPLITDNSIQYANYEDGRMRRALYDPAFQHKALEHYFSVFVKVLYCSPHRSLCCCVQGGTCPALRLSLSASCNIM